MSYLTPHQLPLRADCIGVSKICLHVLQSLHYFHMPLCLKFLSVVFLGAHPFFHSLQTSQWISVIKKTEKSYKLLSKLEVQASQQYSSKVWETKRRGCQFQWLFDDQSTRSWYTCIFQSRQSENKWIVPSSTCFLLAFKKWKHLKVFCGQHRLSCSWPLVGFFLFWLQCVQECSLPKHTLHLGGEHFPFRL